MRFVPGVLMVAIAAQTMSVRAEPVPADHADQPEADAVTTIYVWGKREAGIGTALSASEGIVSYGSFADRPLLRTGEIAEVIPGVAVTQHSGTGKANQYFLRGFNLDHGTDFSIALNGVPLNLRTNAHGQGYLDLNVLIPELVDYVHYRKGPYFADSGDFSAAGSASFTMFRRAPEDFASLTAGENGYGRVLGVKSLNPDSYVALDATTSDGPWDRSEDLKKGTAVYHQMLGKWALTALGYTAQWNSTDQIPQRAVVDGTLSRLGLIDPTDGGRSSRLILAAQRDSEDGWIASAYLQRYRLSLWSNFTYFLDNPVDGDQFEQAEDRWVAGGSLSKVWVHRGEWSLRSGGDLRYDLIDRIGLYRTHARRLLSTDREDRVDQASAALFTDATWQRDAWRATLGLRYDAMTVDVASDNSLNSGNEQEGIVSPTLTVAFKASDEVEFYAATGRGYHSNDARGAVARVSPVSGDPLDPVQLFAPALGAELGVRWERQGFTSSLVLWGLKLDSELVYSGDAGDTESSNASKRYGAELLLNWIPLTGINVDLAAASNSARYEDTDPGEDRIPNALRYVITGGISAALSPNASAEVTVRHLGPAPLIEDGSVSSGTSTLVNLLYRYNFSRVSLFAEVLNVFDRKDNDIDYFYTSRLPGEASEGVADYHFHPMEPRTYRLGLRLSL